MKIPEELVEDLRKAWIQIPASERAKLEEQMRQAYEVTAHQYAIAQGQNPSPLPEAVSVTPRRAASSVKLPAPSFDQNIVGSSA